MLTVLIYTDVRSESATFAGTHLVIDAKVLERSPHALNEGTEAATEQRDVRRLCVGFCCGQRVACTLEMVRPSRIALGSHGGCTRLDAMRRHGEHCGQSRSRARLTPSRPLPDWAVPPRCVTHIWNVTVTAAKGAQRIHAQVSPGCNLLRLC